jgi:hypothetical protein
VRREQHPRADLTVLPNKMRLADRLVYQAARSGTLLRVQLPLLHILAERRNRHR